jgi:hypothetical protein
MERSLNLVFPNICNHILKNLCLQPVFLCFCLDRWHRKLYFKHMDRTVKRELIDEWVREAGRDGVGQLARKSNVPTGSISKIRNGRVPKNVLIRQALAKAIGVSEKDLFPAIGAGEEQAS